MRIFRKLIIAAVLLVAAELPAQSGAEYYFEQGNLAYRAENYREAAEWYQKILATGFTSSQVYYNLGNCYYKLNDIGKAILYYEKARALNPNDPEILLNLELANLKVQDRIEMPKPFFLFRWWERLKHAMGLTGWSQLTAALYVLTISLLIVHLFVRPGFTRKLVRVALFGFAGLTMGAALLLYVNIREIHTQKQAVVLAATVNVLSGPDDNSTDVFVLHEGVKVRLSEQRGEWVKITLPDGKSGWMRRSYLGVI